MRTAGNPTLAHLWAFFIMCVCYIIRDGHNVLKSTISATQTQSFQTARDALFPIIL